MINQRESTNVFRVSILKISYTSLRECVVITFAVAKELNLEYNVHLSLSSNRKSLPRFDKLYIRSFLFFLTHKPEDINTYRISVCICIRRVSRERINRGHAACFLGSGLSHERALNYSCALKRHTRLKKLSYETLVSFAILIGT